MYKRLEKLRNMDADQCLFIIGNVVIAVLLSIAIAAKFFHISIGNGGQCSFYKVTGLYCPGCGGTRSMLHFLRGHFITSMRYNIFMTYLMTWFSLFMISRYLELFTKARIKGMHFKLRYAIIGVILLVVHFVIRNYMLIQYGRYLWPIG